MVIGVAELLRDHGESPERMADLHFVGHAHAAVQLTASWLTRRHASAIFTFAADTMRIRCCRVGLGIDGRHTRGSPSTSPARSSITMSTIRCCSAWNDPIGTPNCLRVFKYSSVASLADLIAPTRLGADQRRGEVDDVLDQRSACPSSPIMASARTCTPSKTMSAARYPSIVR